MRNGQPFSLPTSMQAIVRGSQGPELVRRPLPSCGSDQILIQVRATGVCRTDLNAAFGAISVPEGRVLGHEFSGTVVQCGFRTEGLNIGEHVTAFPFPGRESEACEAEMLGIGSDGAFAEYVTVPAVQAVRVPAGIPFVSAAYAEPVCAAMGILNSGIKPNQCGCVIGHNRFSILAVEILRAFGFKEVAAFSVSELSSMPRRFDFVVETGLSQEVVSTALAALRRGGRLVLKSRAALDIAIPSRLMVEGELKLCGAYYGSFGQAVEIISSGALPLADLAGEAEPLCCFADVFKRATRDERRKLFFAPGEGLCAE